MTAVIIRKYDGGHETDVTVERYGYHHTHENITEASLARLEAICKNSKREFTRKYDHLTTIINM